MIKEVNLEGARSVFVDEYTVLVNSDQKSDYEVRVFTSALSDRNRIKEVPSIILWSSDCKKNG